MEQYAIGHKSWSFGGILAGLLFAVLAGSVSSATIPTQTVTVEFTFNDASNNEDGFYVYRCAGVGCVPTQRVQTLPANSAGFTDTFSNDVGGASHTYGLSAYNSAGESGKVTVTILTPVIIVIPNAPAGLIATIRGVTLQ